MTIPAIGSKVRFGNVDGVIVAQTRFIDGTTSLCINYATDGEVKETLCVVEKFYALGGSVTKEGDRKIGFR